MSVASEHVNGLYGHDRGIAARCGEAVVGLDEAGRGPLAGPVVAGAAMLDLDTPIENVNDSKKLTEARRERLYDDIAEHAVAWAVGIVSPAEIDELNILQASLLAMQRALDQIERTWSLALVDGNRPLPSLPAERQETVVKGDSRSASIAAASIMAKVTRDRLMTEYDREFPAYGFARHKGYPTADHIARVREAGLCPIHRRTFCHKFVAQTVLPL